MHHLVMRQGSEDDYETFLRLRLRNRAWELVSSRPTELPEGLFLNKLAPRGNPTGHQPLHRGGSVLDQRNFLG
jgi:hypothetical protein